jgi:hypothetical protein
MGFFGAELETGFEGRKERIHRFLLGHIHHVRGVGEEEPVLQDHHRQENLLGNFEGLDDRVESLLGALAVELDPARIPLGQTVAVVAPDIPGRANGPVGVDHDHGQPGPGSPVEHLVHVG